MLHWISTASASSSKSSAETAAACLELNCRDSSGMIRDLNIEAYAETVTLHCTAIAWLPVSCSGTAADSAVVCHKLTFVNCIHATAAARMRQAV